MSLNQQGYILPKMPYRQVGFMNQELQVLEVGILVPIGEDIVEIYGSKGKITFLYSKMTLYC
jgi:hypothetical protein